MGRGAHRARHPLPTYYQGGKRFNLFSFWADHKSALPLHEKVFRAEVGPQLHQTRNQGSSHMLPRGPCLTIPGLLPNMDLAQVGPKKAAAANVDSVFSGAGKFTDEAKSAGPKLVSRVTKLHYDWKYDFLYPTNKQVVDRYNQTFRPTVYARLVAAAAASSSAASSSTQRRRRPSGRQTRAGIGMCAQDIRDVGIRHSSELTLSIMGQLMCGNAVVGGAICGCVKPYTHSNFALALFALALLLSGLHSYFKCGQMSALTSHLHFKCSH